MLMPKVRNDRKQRELPKGPQGSEHAARNYLRAHLGWLRGFPLRINDNTVHWQSLPPLAGSKPREILQIDRETIRKAVYARNAARRKFPLALKKVVIDVDQWTRHTDQRFDLLKQAIQFDQPLPDLDTLMASRAVRTSTRERCRRLNRPYPQISRLLEALIWLYWRDRVSFLQMLEQIEQHIVAINALLAGLETGGGLVLAIEATRLLADGASPAFVELLADPRIRQVPLFCDDYIDGLRKPVKQLRSSQSFDQQLVTNGFAHPAPRLGPELVKFVLGAASCSKKMRSGRLQLLELRHIGPLLEEWQNWWLAADQIERKTRKLLGRSRPQLSPEDRPHLKPLKKQITSLEEQIPATFHLAEYGELVDNISVAASEAVFEALVDAAQNLRGELVQKYLANWFNVLRHTSKRPSLLVRLVTSQCQLLEQNWPDKNTLKQQWLVGHLTDELAETWVWDDRPHKLIEPAMKALGLVMKSNFNWHKTMGPFLAHNGWNSVIDAVDFLCNPEDAATAITTVPPGLYPCLYGKYWLALLKISAGDMDYFEAMAKGWKLNEWSEQFVNELNELAKHPDAATLIGQAIASGEGSNLPRPLALSRLYRALGLKGDHLPEPFTEAAFDLSPYPPELHAPLLQLSLFDPAARSAADKILRKDFPQSDHLKGELSALRERVLKASDDRKPTLEARINAIRRVLAEPAPVSAARMNNLRARLERRISHARLARWREKLLGRVQAGLAQKIGMVDQDWLERPHVLSVLSSLGCLPAGSKKLAFALLKLRNNGPKPWDMRIEPPNRTFLGMLANKGIKTAPWLEGIGPKPVTIGGKVLTFDLECDPLEIMRMGEPFNTCLTPGSFNFFSAISNAGDINKRVLYGRDKNGAIHLRCLLALTDEGHILTFYVYAHNDQEKAKEAVKSYVAALAGQMRTTMASNGNVRTLVANDWYDDGPIDLTNRLKFLDPGSAFVKSLPQLAPQNLLTALEKALDGHPLTPAVICAVGNLEQVQKRPELITPLLPLIATAPNMLDPWCHLSLVTLARRSGEAKTAYRLLKPLEKHVLGSGEMLYRLDAMVAQELAELGLAHRALALIRQTRPDYIKSWDDETNDRLLAAGDALLALYRPRKALALYRIAEKDGFKKATKRINQLQQNNDLR